MPRDDERVMVCFTKNCSPYRAGERAAFPRHKALKLASTGVGYIEGTDVTTTAPAASLVKDSNVVDWPEDPGEPKNPKFRKPEPEATNEDDDNDEDSESDDDDGDEGDGDEGTTSEPEPEAKPVKAKKPKKGKAKKRRTKLSE